LMSSEDAKSTETQLKMPEMKDWPDKERLANEKESLGFYVSGHPLDWFESEVKKLTITTQDLLNKGFKEGDSGSLAGIIINNTIRLNKKSEKFSILKIEDLRGSMEIPVYVKLYAEVKDLLTSDDPILIKGRVNFRDDEIGIIAENIQLLSSFREESCKKVHMEINDESMSSEQFNKLKQVFLTSPGECQVAFKVWSSSDSYAEIKIPDKIAPTSKFTEGMSEFKKQVNLQFVY